MFAFRRINVHVIALFVVSTLSIAESASASARVDEAPSVIVQYHDLNLDSREGVAGLYERIQAAAAVVCKSVEVRQRVNHLFWAERDACINHAVAEAVHAVHNENLSAYHWERIRVWKRRFAAVSTGPGGH
jgi:UrcA family protein